MPPYQKYIKLQDIKYKKIVKRPTSMASTTETCFSPYKSWQFSEKAPKKDWFVTSNEYLAILYRVLEPHLPKHRLNYKERQAALYDQIEYSYKQEEKFENFTVC